MQSVNGFLKIKFIVFYEFWNIFILMQLIVWLYISNFLIIIVLIAVVIIASGNNYYR